MFKVVPDQLRISDGWVRCGQCDEVFDANAHLQPAFDVPPASVPSESPDVVDWGGILEADTSVPELSIPLEFPSSEPPGAPASAKTTEPDPIPSAFALDDPQANADELAPVDPGVVGDADPFEVNPREDAAEPATLELPNTSDKPLVQEFASAPTAKEPEVPQFLKQQPTIPAKGVRLGRFSAITLGVLLAVTLVAQAVVQQRDRIVATAPSVIVWLEPVCHLLECHISPLQQIESIVIDHSSFSKGQSEGYVLAFAVKSTAVTDVAIPSLELTLTDMQDRALVRRVFSPRELGYQHPVLGPGGEWSTTVPIEVKLSEGGERITGYRLLAFYP